MEFTDDAPRDFLPELPRHYVGGFYDNLGAKHFAYIAWPF